jgi:hypothetical protein
MFDLTNDYKNNRSQIVSDQFVDCLRWLKCQTMVML